MSVVIEFLSTNWINILLIFVGSFALLVYWLQERRKIIEAASLILLQIDELREKIIEISSYISNSQLNATAFYESQALFTEDYWTRYKHFFIRRMDAKSFHDISLLYAYATEIQEQQQLMKNLQKNFFFVKQQSLTNMEMNYIFTCLESNQKYPFDMQKVATGLMNTMHNNFEPEQKTAIENMFQWFSAANQTLDYESFWKAYTKKRNDLVSIIDHDGLTTYIPVQIRLSLEKALKEYSLLEITGSDGYKKLQKLSKRKF